MPQIVHRPTVFNDEERYPLRSVLCKEYPYPENQGERFYDPKDAVKDLFVAGAVFVVGDVSKEFPHSLFSFDYAILRADYRGADFLTVLSIKRAFCSRTIRRENSFRS
jgi:hypothetical protein